MCAVMEVSSHGIKLRRVDQLDFDIAIFTNLSPDHYDLHPDFQDYFLTKRSWYDSLKDEACIIYNIDDPFCEQMVSKSPVKTKISYGIRGKGQIQARNIVQSQSGAAFDLVIPQPITGLAGKLGLFSLEPKATSVKVKMFGNHNCYNALAAATVALINGVHITSIKKSLENFSGVWRRLEFLQEQPFTVIDDASHNSINFQAVFETVKDFKYQNMWVVVGIRGSRGWQINYENASMIGEYCKHLGFNLVVTKSFDTNSSTDELLEDEEKAFVHALWEKKIDFSLYDTLDESLERVVGEAKAGDIILLLGAHPFDNVRELIKPILAKKIQMMLPIKDDSYLPHEQRL
jgi:UDP-N-acetylmuramoyl-L-alanyl-D-glutamate--2,6-diaminopimelate ligase